MFVDKKIEIFLKDKNNTSSSHIIDLCKRQEIKDHTFLALKILLNQNNLLLDTKKFKKVSKEFDVSETTKKQEKGAIGIVIYTELSKKFIFVHLTYAEYFAAIYLVNKIESDINTAFQCMDEIMINSSLVFLHCINFLLKEFPEKYNSCFNGMTLLNYAAANNHINIVKKLIPNENNCPQKDLQNRTPLQCAAINGNIKIVVYLLAYYSFCNNATIKDLIDFTNIANNIQHQDVHKKNAVDYAKQHSDILKLFDTIIKLTNIYEQSNTPGKTFEFSQTKYEIACKLLLQKFFINPENLGAAQIFLNNIENEEMRENIVRSTHFHSAVLDSNILLPLDRNNKLQFLLDNDWVPKHYKNGSFVTLIIMESIKYRRYSTTKHFLKQVKDEKFEKYLAKACECGDVKVINHLLKFYNQNINNALHIIATFLSNDENFFKIINIDWDEINVKDFNGDTPLIIALRRKRWHKLIKLLLNKGATVDMQNNMGETALSVVIDKNINYGNLFYFVELLIKKAPHPENLVNIPDNKGETPLFHAIRRISLYIEYEYYDETDAKKNRNRVSTIADLVDCLIECGANVNHKNNDGKTPLDILPTISEIPLSEFNIEIEIPRIKKLLLQKKASTPAYDCNYPGMEDKYEDEKSPNTPDSDSSYAMSIYSSDSEYQGDIQEYRSHLWSK